MLRFVKIIRSPRRQKFDLKNELLKRFGHLTEMTPVEIGESWFKKAARPVEAIITDISRKSPFLRKYKIAIIFY